MLFLSTDDKQTKLNFGKVTTKKTVPAESFTISDSEDEAWREDDPSSDEENPSREEKKQRKLKDAVNESTETIVESLTYEQREVVADHIVDRCGCDFSKCEDGIAHDERRLGWVKNDDRFSNISPSDVFNRSGSSPRELIDVGSRSWPCRPRT